MTWQPIETAPKGTWLLGAWASGSDHADWLPMVMAYMWERWIDGACDTLPAPTHWMPLPAPPAAQEDARG